MSHTHDSKSGSGLVSTIIGFVLTLVLTLLSYYFVKHHTFGTTGLYAAITLMTIFQALVWIACYMRLGADPENGKWDIIAFLFTLVIVAVVVIGTLWIMYNLNYNMVH